jgi:glycosyltransferase involved in cell wall biosynthesis
MDRPDRYFFKTVSWLQNLLPGFYRNYHFRSYFHRAYIRKAAQFLAEREVDSIVFPIYPQWARQLRAVNPKARLILWMQCEWLSAGPPAYEKYLEAIDRVICCSAYIAEKIAARFPWARDRLYVVPNGVDTRVFTPSSSRSRHLILHAGRLTPEKGAHTLLEAFERVSTRYPDAQLVLSGPFWVTPPAHLRGAPREAVRTWKSVGRRYEHLIRKKAQQLNSVFLTGHVPHRALVRIYRSASVFVHPALWNEPFGMILAEAMACGLPVVASRSGGIPEVVQDGRTGLLVDPGDVDGLAAAIDRIFDNRELAARMGVAARARAEELFDWEHVAGRVAEIALEA